MNVLSWRFRGWPPTRQAQVKRHLIRVILLLIALWVGYGLVAGEAGVLRILSLQRKARALEADVARLEARTREIQRQRELLATDPAYQERIAREECGLARPDELVFRFAAPGEQVSTVQVATEQVAKPGVRPASPGERATR